MFIERKIISKMHGKKESDFSALIGVKALEESVIMYKESGLMQMTRLVVDLKDVDPDDAFSSIPYEKGFHFLVHLEKILGGDSVFDRFLKAYICKFAGLSISTKDFVDFLYAYFEDQKNVLDSVDWNAWLYGEGMVGLLY